MSVRSGVLAQAPRCGGGQGESRRLARQCRTAPRGRGLPAATVRGLVAWGLAAAVLWAGWMLLLAAGGGTPARVYSVTAVGAGLERTPAGWVGRTVRVRGIAIAQGCSGWDHSPQALCPSGRQGLVNPVGVALLPITGEAPHPLLALLRHVPLLGELVPRSQLLHWGVVATYRVRLRATSAALCSGGPCYEALLLDAAPDALLGE